MTTTYYSVSGAPATSSAGSSATMRSEFALIEAGFALLPSLTSAGNRIPHINSGSTAQTTTSGFTFDGTTFTAPAMSSTGVMTLGGALTYGGVTLSNSVTGTGSMMLSASPTTTGTLTAAAITASGNGSFGPGGSASAQTTITANGSSANTYGPGIYLQRNSVSKGVLATESQLAANNSDNIWLYAYAGASLKLYGGGNLGQTIDASGNVSMPGTLGVTGTATMAAINASGALTGITGVFTGAGATPALSNGNLVVSSGTTTGAIIAGKGSSTDLYLANSSYQAVLTVAAGTTNVTIPNGTFAVTNNATVGGTLGVTGALTVTGNTSTSGSNIFPSAGNTGSVGTATNYYSAGYFGTGGVTTDAIIARVATVALTGNQTISGTLGVTGVATLTAQPILSSLTASQAVFSDGSKGLVSNAITGTGSVVMSTNAILVTPNIGTPSAGVATNLTGTASGLSIGGNAATATTATTATGTNALYSATTTVNVSSATAPSSGQVLTATGSATATWQTPVAGATVPTGAMFDYAGAGTIPAGYLACDGSNYATATYPALSAVLGTTWGAPGGGNFTVPDSRRRVSVGSGGTAVSGPANTVGSVGGEETHVQSTAEIAAHTHANTPVLASGTISATTTGTVNGATTPAGKPDKSGSVDVQGIGAAAGSVSGSVGTSITANNASIGSSTAFNVMQPSYVVQKIIKT